MWGGGGDFINPPLLDFGGRFLTFKVALQKLVPNYFCMLMSMGGWVNGSSHVQIRVPRTPGYEQASWGSIYSQMMLGNWKNLGFMSSVCPNFLYVSFTISVCLFSKCPDQSLCFSVTYEFKYCWFVSVQCTWPNSEQRDSLHIWNDVGYIWRG